MSDRAHLTLRQQLIQYKQDPNSFHCSNFYDWFCKDKSLPGKAKLLWSKLKKFASIVPVDWDNTYCFFKNNCPLDGRLYDDFRICDIKTGDVIFTVIPSCGHTHTKGQAEVWGKKNDFKEPIVVKSSWTELVDWLRDNHAALSNNNNN